MSYTRLTPETLDFNKLMQLNKPDLATLASNLNMLVNKYRVEADKIDSLLEGETVDITTELTAISKKLDGIALVDPFVFEYDCKDATKSRCFFISKTLIIYNKFRNVLFNGPF